MVSACTCVMYVCTVCCIPGHCLYGCCYGFSLHLCDVFVYCLLYTRPLSLCLLLWFQLAPVMYVCTVCCTPGHCLYGCCYGFSLHLWCMCVLSAVHQAIVFMFVAMVSACTCDACVYCLLYIKPLSLRLLLWFQLAPVMYVCTVCCTSSHCL